MSEQNKRRVTDANKGQWHNIYLLVCAAAATIQNTDTTLNNIVMPFATVFFDSDNTTIVLERIILTVKGIISSYLMMIVWCTRTHGNGQVNDVANVEMDIHEMAPPCRSLPRPGQGILWRRRWKGLLWSLTVTCFHILIVVSEHFMDMGFY